MRRTRVKICGLTNLADARWAWQCGADLLGFILVQASPRCIARSAIREIVSTLRHEGCDCKMVGVFAGQPVGEVQLAVDRTGLDLAQLHGGESASYVRELARAAIVARRVRRQVPWDELLSLDAWAHLLDSYDPNLLGGSGQSWDWRLAEQAVLYDRRVIIAGGLSPANVGQAVRQLAPWGVDVSSGVEDSPGRKDHDKVRNFVERVREAETS